MRSKLNIIFWQNTNSIHQAEFLKALAKKVNKVTLIVTEPLTEHRKNMGWMEPDLQDSVKVIYWYESNIPLSEFILAKSSRINVHIFSGINAFPSVHKAFLLAIQFNCIIGILTEPLDARGFKGKLRIARGYYHAYKFRRKIDFILAIGPLAVKQFLSWGYSFRIVYEWAYTVEKSIVDLEKDFTTSSEFKVMFAGSLIHRKGYDILIQAFKLISEPRVRLDMYCLREDQLELGSEIQQRARENGRMISLLPFLKNSDLRRRMIEYDLFILPSRHDGWGAVVNESLAEGLPVLVSPFCGSSTLVQNNKLEGTVLKNLSVKTLAERIDVFLKRGKVSMADRRKNRHLAEKCIGGDALANYFIKILVTIDNEKGARPLAPWK